MSKKEAQTDATRVLAGAGCAVMNPPKGLPLLGYPSPRPNTGVGLDLCARALALAAPGCSAPQAAVVVLDNLGADLPLVKEIRRRAAQAVPGLEPRTLLVAATHTHSAPTLRTYQKAGRETVRPDPQYVERVIAASVQAVAAAWQAARPTTMRAGRTQARLGHNRRVLDDQGVAHAEWLDPDGKHTGYYDPQLPFVVFEDATSGKVHAMVVSYWCHPVTLGPANFQASPDYPGYFVRELESRTGAPTVLHVTGGGGNINPRQALAAGPEHAETMGRQLADEVLAALDSARPLKALPVVSASAPLVLEVSDDVSDFLKARAGESPDGRRLTTEVQAIAAGEAAFVTAPGELFSEIGGAMQKASPFAHTMVVSQGNDYLGYLFTDQARAEGGYEPSHPIAEQIEQPLLAAAAEALREARNPR